MELNFFGKIILVPVNFWISNQWKIRRKSIAEVQVFYVDPYQSAMSPYNIHIFLWMASFYVFRFEGFLNRGFRKRSDPSTLLSWTVTLNYIRSCHSSFNFLLDWKSIIKLYPRHTIQSSFVHLKNCISIFMYFQYYIELKRCLYFSKTVSVKFVIHIYCVFIIIFSLEIL